VSTTDPVKKTAKGDINAPAAKSKSKFERVEPGLYRYRTSGVFYSVLKKDGKTIWKNLQVTDKPTARRLLVQERDDQEGLDSNLSGLEFGTLTDKYLGTIAHLAPKTVATRKSVVKLLKGTFKEHRKVRDIKPSELGEWAGKLVLEERSFNEYIRVTKKIFKLAVSDRAISKSPAEDLKSKKLHDVDHVTPEQEQFFAIVADIRAQRFNARAKDSADFVEFMALAGLGQAELRNLRLCDYKKEKAFKTVVENGVSRKEEREVERLECRRSKTGKSFRIPVYPKAKPLLTKLIAQASLPSPRTNEEKANFPFRRLFRINDAKKAIEGACKRLGFPQFEQRSLRRLFITDAVEKGLTFKVIAATQGHSDGGVLIAKTYSHLRTEHLDEMAARLV
jgi:integrase